MHSTSAYLRGKFVIAMLASRSPETDRPESMEPRPRFRLLKRAARIPCAWVRTSLRGEG